MPRTAGLALALAAALTGRAAAEGQGGRGRLPSTDRHVYGADFLKPVAGGLAAVGGPTLRWLPPGGKKWKDILTVKGHLSRIGWDDAGARVLAVWEEEKTVMHLLGLRDRSHALIPLPPMGSTPQAQFYYVDSVSFVPGRNEAVVAMSGPDRRGSAYRVSKAYLVPLDGQAGPAEPRLLWDVHNSGEPVWTSAAGALYILPPTPDYKYHWAASLNGHLAAYLLRDGAVTEQVVYDDPVNKFRSIRAAAGSTPERWIGIVTTGRGGYGVLRYRWGDSGATYQDLPSGLGPNGGAFLNPNAEEMLFVLDHGRDLEFVRRALPPGTEQHSVSVYSPRFVPEVRSGSRTLASHLFGMGFRAGGGIWVHLGDDMALIGADGSLRHVDLAKMYGGHPEWAGSSLAVGSPEGLWIGIEIGSGRDYQWFGFADMERRADAWPPRPLPPAGALPYDHELRMTKCLPPETLIATPRGEVPVSRLEIGQPVWTRDAAGRRVAGTVLRVRRLPVGPDHRVVRLVLADGRTLRVSAGHPLPSGAGVESLAAGESLDGSRIRFSRLETYDGDATWDLLPSGPTGLYWANAIPLGSTLKRP